MKTEDIKTWKQSEIDELRAALKDRDAEIARVLQSQSDAAGPIHARKVIGDLRAALKERDVEVEKLRSVNLEVINWFEQRTKQLEKQRAVMQQVQDFLRRVRHWEEGKPDLHDIKTALKEALK